MKTELSILIPTYNGDCRELVAELSAQATAISGLDYEIIVADDGSPDRTKVELCREVERHPRCRFIDRGTNVGRAAIRNFLAREATKEWLLFIDCDMSIISSYFLVSYLEAGGDVVYGGYRVKKSDKSWCLRYKYEWATQNEHTAGQRRKRPYQHFHTCNFLVSRKVMLAHPFNENFRKYGYEDVLFGRHLREADIAINHQENPLGFLTFEDNDSFVSKTEEGLRTLHQFRNELRGYSQMLTFVEGIHLGAVRWLIRLWHRLFGKLERRNLCGKHPSLRIFKLYKLGYFMKQ
ncbi:MAG: glycosyltransferase family 2 protein [Prevotella sp.]|nr:glycosyltransferase family 2 protein [Prevotella sp.]